MTPPPPLFFPEVQQVLFKALNLTRNVDVAKADPAPDAPPPPLLEIFFGGGVVLVHFACITRIYF